MMLFKLCFYHDNESVQHSKGNCKHVFYEFDYIFTIMYLFKQQYSGLVVNTCIFVHCVYINVLCTIC